MLWTFVKNRISTILRFFFQYSVFLCLKVTFNKFQSRLLHIKCTIASSTQHQSLVLLIGDEVHCHRFVECSALAYAINALTSHDKDMRQLAYQILSRFQQHLTTARFRAKPQVITGNWCTREKDYQSCLPLRMSKC